MAEKKTGEKLWTIPNVVSMLRILLIIPIVDQLRGNHAANYRVAFILIVVAYLTDFLDGYLARVLKSESKFGQILDPIGDKLLAVIVSAVLFFSGDAPPYFFFLILARDIVISLGAIYVINFKKYLVLPLVSGKITTIALGVVLSLYALKLSELLTGPFWKPFIAHAALYGTWVVCGLLIFSGVFYGVNYYKYFVSHQGKK